MRPRHAHCCIPALLACLLSQTAFGGAQGDAGHASTLARVTALRDSFIARLKADGFSCPIAAPAVVIDHVISFGNYDDTANVLHIRDWGELSVEERGLFFRIAGPAAGESAAHAAFEDGVDHWVLVHELGHWWQACRHAHSAQGHYQMEYGANRIAFAYWREADPGLTNRMLSVFRGMVDHVPNPVPQGHATEAYFNSHYEQIAPTADYAWYQSYMSLTASEEKPAPSFATALAETGRDGLERARGRGRHVRAGRWLAAENDLAQTSSVP
jgi:hypothetical protein